MTERTQTDDQSAHGFDSSHLRRLGRPDSFHEFTGQLTSLSSVSLDDHGPIRADVGEPSAGQICTVFVVANPKIWQFRISGVGKAALHQNEGNETE